MKPGVVVIGRNEGERLRRCLESLGADCARVVYVDSGSTDGSVELAQRLGAAVVELDLGRPFTAARARNAGFARLRELAPELVLAQFVDGDCEVVAGWLTQAAQFMTNHPDVAAVCGRRRERHPECSVYNRLCDMEWNTPVGEAKACGGDALMRVAALAAVNGYRESLIAGEEPELCVRLRAAGWRIWRLDAEMTLHDAAMLRFEQWWRRAVRGGYAFAEGSRLHGGPPERHWVAETRRAWVWGLALPSLALILLPASPLLSACMLLAYPAQVARLALATPGADEHRWLRAAHLVASKFPEAVGVLRHLRHRLSGIEGRLIEYK